MLEEREGETVASQTEMEAVYRLHIGAVYRLCYSYLGSAAKAEDAAQAVFLSLVELSLIHI